MLGGGLGQPDVLAGAEPQQSRPAVAPVRSEERIHALDTIRGFALLGILLMNVCSFGLPDAAYANPAPAGGASGWNLIAWSIMAVLADGKMRAIFSLTFGAGVYLLNERLSRKGAAADAADIHYRRMLWLMLFGMMHAYLIWDGDILFYYAVLGLGLYPLRKLSPRALLITAACLLIAMSGGAVLVRRHLMDEQRQYAQIQADAAAGIKITADQRDAKKDWEEIVARRAPSAEDLKRETDAHQGGYFKLLVFRAQEVYRLHSAPIYWPDPWFDMLMMMLIGIAMIKTGVLTGGYSRKFYVWMALLSFAIGMPADSWAIGFITKHDFSIDSFSATLIEYEFGRFTAFGYIALILLALKSGILRGATRTLAYVGQMAFSNYILTSLICTTLFEGYGFGLFGKLQRYQLYGIVFLVWLVILIVSPYWLRRFRFGPLEWAWRSLTYWKKQPFRRDKFAGTGAGFATGFDTR
ncbi:MAG: DUF418 domain-containing protein [Steroidobacteraceae bacterium]